MKPKLMILLVILSLLTLTLPLQAQEEKPFRFDLYSFEGAQGIGFKYEISSILFLTLNRDGEPYERLNVQIGKVIYLPKNLYFLSFYGGGGMAIDVYNGQGFPYILTGMEAAILFGETLYFFDNEGIRTRMGLRFTF